MSVTSHRKAFCIALAAALAGSVTPSTATGLQAEVDQGLAAGDQPVTVSLVLRLRNEAALEAYALQTATPGNPNFQKFISTAEFAQR